MFNYVALCLGCVDVSQNSSNWLISSFGRFSVLTTVTDLQTLNPSFSVVRTHTHTRTCSVYRCMCWRSTVFVQLDTLGLLSLRQLVEVSSSPGFLSSAAAVDNLLLYVPDAQFTAFISPLSTTLQVTHTHLFISILSASHSSDALPFSLIGCMWCIWFQSAD